MRDTPMNYYIVSEISDKYKHTKTLVWAEDEEGAKDAWRHIHGRDGAYGRLYADQVPSSDAERQASRIIKQADVLIGRWPYGEKENGAT